MNIAPINTNINFKSVLPPQQANKKDGWDRLNELCNTRETKGMLNEALKSLAKNDDKNILALEYFAPSSISSVEAFSFRLYENLEDLEYDRAKWATVPQKNLNKNLLLEFFGSHTCKTSYGFLGSSKSYLNAQEEKVNKLLEVLNKVITKGTKENITVFGKPNFGELAQDAVSKFRIKV